MTDLISRADAIEAIKKYNFKIPPYMEEVSEGFITKLRDAMKTDLIGDIQSLPSADAEWIPCSDRLPEEKQEVYVTVYFIEGDTGRAYGYMDGFGKWHLYSVVEGTLNSGYEVIAWMPLPKPYREDGEEE